MDGEFTTPQWRPEPEPSNALERLMAKAAADPAYHGPMMRALWDAEIHTLMPYHPEMAGTHQYQPGQQMQFIVLKDQVGPFIPAFTSEATAEYCIQKNAPKNAAYGLATFPGELFFPLVNSLNQTVVFNSGMMRNLVIKPEAIQGLVSGEFRHSRPSHGPGEMTHLYGVEHDSLPAEFTQSIRNFCDRNRVPIAVYVFVPGHPETGAPEMGSLRLILRLRHEDNDFYNDFSLMAGKLTPKGIDLATGVVTDTDEQALEFLNRSEPLWPVLDL